VLDWKTGKLTRWHTGSAPEVDLSGFVRAKLETYPARDGTAIPVFVREPKSCARPCPVVVDFHGGPEAQAKPGFWAFAQILVDAGFILVEPNVRGSDGYGKTWIHADDGPKRAQIITDIEDAARWARQRFGGGKVGILGGSYGGYSSLIGMTMFAGAYDAGVAIVGISNLVTFLMNTAPYRRALRISEYGDPEKDRDALLKLSPITYIDKVQGPLLLIQGASDPRVPVGEALQIHDALQAHKLPVELVIFSDEGHGAQRRDNQVYQIGYSLRFFQKYLQGKPIE
jgi:dipeptidyl aminopeptidase/acylaminoacyl peptidase